MHFLTIIILLAFAATLAFFILRRVFPALVRRKATMLLDVILFPDGSSQKQEVINNFRQITNHRFNTDELLDYYYKIKGIRTLSGSCRWSFTLKKYLFTPTNIKLTYFEQCRFYDTFLHQHKKTHRLNHVMADTAGSSNNSTITSHRSTNPLSPAYDNAQPTPPIIKKDTA